MSEAPRGTLGSLKDRVSILRVLTDEEVDCITPYFEHARCPQGTLLFREGEPGDSMGLVLSGIFEVHKKTEFEGKEIVLAKNTAGSFLGELSMFDGRPRSANVVAREDSEVLIIRRDALDACLEAHPHAGIKMLREIIRILSLRLRNSAERLSAIF
jgi:CRP-like cAMP-binding protein